MKRLFAAFLIIIPLACKESSKSHLTAQEIVDRSIEASGGMHYADHNTSFFFRDRKYISENVDGKKILKRITFLDTVMVTDIRGEKSFQRFMNDSLVAISDSIANRYANSVNSVHYFARLPYGLNDGAVNKELLGEETIKGKEYYKIKVTFEQQGGGKDFDDTYMYWFDKQTFKPNYLAYDFHVDGGGQRFREAFNERYVNGIRFADYHNYKPKLEGVDVSEMGKLFEKGELELLSKIELEKIEVTGS
ncbi:MAG: DUF6503 family protein [Allomuricauda sp.]